MRALLILVVLVLGGCQSGTGAIRKEDPIDEMRTIIKHSPYVPYEKSS